MTLPVRARTLDNGLLVLVRESHAAPVVSVGMWYRVGGRDDPPGRTGLSHWVEHMLFKATRAFPNGEIPTLLSGAGAEWNACTWLDYTACFATLPNDALDLVLRIEADRMANCLMDDAAVARERPFLLAERATDGQQPMVILREQSQCAAFGAHPYGRPPAGTSADLTAATRADVLEHYRTWYRPNNAVLVVVGDVEAEHVHLLAERHFGALRPGRVPERPPVARRVECGPRRITAHAPAPAPLLHVALPVPPANHLDTVPLSLAAAVLGQGRLARAQQALVTGGLALGVRVAAGLAREPHVLTLDATVWPTADRARTEAAALGVLRGLADGLALDELAAARRRLRHAFVLGTEGSGSQARLLGRYEMVASHCRFTSYLDDLAAVTADDVVRVAATYLQPEWATVSWLVPDPVTGVIVGGGGSAEHVHS